MSPRGLLTLLFSLGCAPTKPTHTEVVSDPPKEVEWCVNDKDCSPHLGHCLSTCYKYNHPNGPLHDACDTSCRRNYCGRIPCDASPCAAGKGGCQ